jgi:hypothetical protein
MPRIWTRPQKTARHPRRAEMGRGDQDGPRRSRRLRGYVISGFPTLIIQEFEHSINETTDLGHCTWPSGLQRNCNVTEKTATLPQIANFEANILRFNFVVLKPLWDPIDAIQPPSTRTDITKTNDIPFRKGIRPLVYASTSQPQNSPAIKITTFHAEPPQISSDQSRGGGTSWINPRKYEKGATRSEAVKRDFRDLGGTKDISLVNKAKGITYQSFRIQSTLVDARHVPGTPRNE